VSVDVETILYAIFDVTAKCIFGFILVLGHSSINDEEEAVILNPSGSRP
jgi:bacteriorhodopsin